jgi:predicted TIM-barrel fold metal-dependent hydrolase
LTAILEKNPQYEKWAAFCASPRAFLNYLDSIGIERAMLVSTAAPDVIGIPQRDINNFVTEYVKEDTRRLIASGGLHPYAGMNVAEEFEQLLRMGIRMIKLHPPHQFFFPNAYRDGFRELETLYRMAEENGVPVMFHTGTSVFPGARNKYGDPIHIDDVAVDFPKLKIILAHGGRPLWAETAFFLMRRHPNVFLDISSIPPQRLLTHFPKLEQIAGKTLFGTDWPSVGVPEIHENLVAVRDLPLSDEAKDAIFSKNALKLWPA